MAWIILVGLFLFCTWLTTHSSLRVSAEGSHIFMHHWVIGFGRECLRYIVILDRWLSKYFIKCIVKALKCRSILIAWIKLRFAVNSLLLLHELGLLRLGVHSFGSFWSIRFIVFMSIKLFQYNLTEILAIFFLLFLKLSAILHNFFCKENMNFIFFFFL